MTDIDSILQTQTYHIFYKNKLLKQLSAQTPLKLKATIKEHVNPPKTNKKVFAIRIKLNSNNPKSKLIITCLQQTITPNLNFITDKGDHMIVVEYSDEELSKYGFKLSHIKKIIKALEKRTVSLEKNFISISEILE
jgi:hypothetical protein